MNEINFIKDFFLKINLDCFDSYFLAANYVIEFLSGDNAEYFHHQIATEVVLDSEYKNFDAKDKIINILASKLWVECAKFSVQWNQIKTEPFFTLDGRFILDELFAKYVVNFGSYGKKFSDDLLQASFQWSRSYQPGLNESLLFKLWVDLDKYPYFCRYAKILAEILWVDEVVRLAEKKKKHLPALTQSIYRPMCRVLSPSVQIFANNGSISVYHEGSMLGEVLEADLENASLISTGLQNLNSIYHHKLFRFLCLNGFENWVIEKTEPRLLRYERGETEISEILGFKFKGAPFIIRSLLYLQSKMRFFFDDGTSGNLIALRKFRSQITNRDDGIEIVLGVQLMPHYTFQINRGRLLVPITELPSFISPSQYHAGQALLQMLLMDEFTNQSIALSSEGSIEIGQEKWEMLQRESGLPISIFRKTLAFWLSFQGGVLTKIKEGRYGLSQAFRMEESFLNAQGVIRKNKKRLRRIADKKIRNIESEKSKSSCLFKRQLFKK